MLILLSLIINNMNKFNPLLFTLFSILFANHIIAQEVIDIVDPYEMKVSRSPQADTFYFTQKNSTPPTIYKLDTLRTYDVYLEERKTPFGTAYMCNGAEITKQKYEAYKRFWNTTGSCQPCLLYTFNDKEQLKYVAFQYENCLCGSYKEYYPEGTLKTEGQFKQNPSTSWENIKLKGICNIREGKWIYYTAQGDILKTETYQYGKLINSENGIINNNTTTNKNPQQSTDNTPKIRKKLFGKKITETDTSEQ